MYESWLMLQVFAHFRVSYFMTLENYQIQKFPGLIFKYFKPNIIFKELFLTSYQILTLVATQHLTVKHKSRLSYKRAQRLLPFIGTINLPKIRTVITKIIHSNANKKLYTILFNKKPNFKLPYYHKSIAKVNMYAS